MEVEHLIDVMRHGVEKDAYNAFKQLVEISKDSDAVYAYSDSFWDMIEADNSFVRNQGLLLIAANAKWDSEYKIDEHLEQYLTHLSDPKPITVRQCLKGLTHIVKEKADLLPDIEQALYQAQPERYQSSMRDLIERDIAKLLKLIKKLKEQ